MRRPNVLLFISHDTGESVSPYGYETFHTPHLERLAAEGVRFANSFCTFPVCSPSRAAIVTGRYPHQNGVNGLVGPARGWALHPGERHAASLFAEGGYESVLCGMVHETNHCETLGFERLLCGPGKDFNDGGDLLDFGEGIRQWLGERDGDRPFYLQIGCSDTHRQWTKRAEPDDSRGVWRPTWLKDLPEVRQDVTEFQGAVRRLDAGIGRILRALDDAGVADDTIVCFTTDHGEDLPFAKGTLREHGLRVFHFMRYPAGDWRPGAVVEEMISNVDILPTLLEACGLPARANLAGRSFLARLTGQGDYTPRDAVHAEKTFQDFYDPRRCVRTHRHKYVRFFEASTYQDLRMATTGRQHQFVGRATRGHIEELFDLQADPDELNNLADDPACRDVLDEHRRRLAEWMAETSDPLLQGPMESPLYTRARDELRRFARRHP